MNASTQNKPEESALDKTIYGPVKSWRFGQSLGIDPIFEISTCSFNCVYCQLGSIQRVTAERKVYVQTKKVLQDFTEVLNDGKNFDVITFSGSGEPTLATNLGEMALGLKKLCPGKPLLVLTNATLMHNLEVQKDLQIFNRVIAKLDAPNDQTLQMMNRPAPGVTMQQIIEGIIDFRKKYTGILDIQMMFMPANISEVDDLAELLLKIKPDTVQLNTPLRPYPMTWDRDSRGNHSPNRSLETRTLRVISKEEAAFIENTLKEKTGLNILSIYRE